MSAKDSVRVLVVDDSAVMRRIICDALSDEESISVVDVAANGKLALSKLEHKEVDLVTLDVEMPELGGIETLQEIKKNFPKVQVVMVSSLTERGASVTLDALSLGALDYVTKPSKRDEAFSRELIAKLTSLRGSASSAAVPDDEVIRAAPIKKSRAKAGIWDALAIGISTGGPNALSEVIPRLSKNFPVPIFITQHMPPLFTKLLADRLNEKSQIQVVEAAEGMEVKPGVAYIAPGDNHMLVEKKGGIKKITLSKGPHVNSCRPAVDPMLTSIGEVYGNRVITLIMTGMGYDGLKGASHLASLGGFVMAQDEASSVVWGMPGAVVSKGIASEVLSLQEIPTRLAEIFR